MRLEQEEFSRKFASLFGFQFHKGAIRTLMLMDNSKNKSNFNSIKVRLERSVVTGDLSASAFQFHKGAIRTLARTNVSEIFFCISIP